MTKCAYKRWAVHPEHDKLCGTLIYHRPMEWLSLEVGDRVEPMVYAKRGIYFFIPPRFWQPSEYDLGVRRFFDQGSGDSRVSEKTEDDFELPALEPLRDDKESEMLTAPKSPDHVRTYLSSEMFLSLMDSLEKAGK